tara:strand:- start:3685 stop:5043 length:1359 start_codon:yes stop_codon:yes gene_type:complete
MHVLGHKSYVVLLLGDISILYLSVWLTLFIRHGSIPDLEFASVHLASFSVLFVAWFVVFIVGGLYGRYTLLFKRKLPTVLFSAQAINIAIAALFFFLIPFFKITPKTVLVIYLFVSSTLLYVWRMYVYPHLLKRREVGAVVIGTGSELTKLAEHINRDTVYPMVVRAIIHPELSKNADIKRTVELLIESGAVTTIVVDMSNRSIDPLLDFVYYTTFIERSASFIDVRDIYQEVFERVPLSLIDDRWILKNVSVLPQQIYDVVKRVIDVVLSIGGLIISAVLFPIIAIAIKVEDGGSVFVTQERVGKHTITFTSYKFRSMSYSDQGAWIGENKNNTVTKVGGFLRKYHLDELPQLWNVLKGDMSLVGPRPDIAGLYSSIVSEIPFYKLRYTIHPGLTGWAQTTQEYEEGNMSPQSMDATRLRLQYDLFYVRHRSLLLDAKIILRTINTVLFGR